MVSRIQVYRTLILFTVLGIVLGGCGSSSEVFVGAPGTARTQLLYGRAVLDGPLGGATAEITSLAGVPLGYPSDVVDSTGNFRIPVDAALPPEFRVRVTPGSGSRWNLPIIVDVQNFSGQTAVFPNILTTLTALYREQSGGSLPEATSWVRSKLGIPAGVDLGYGIDESRRSPFRHSAFLAQAEANGGVSDYLTALLSGQPVLGQLENSATGDGVLKGFGDIGTSIIVNIGANIIIDLGDKVFGLVAQSLGLNIGSSDENQEVADQLTDIQNSLDALGASIDQDFATLQNITEAQTLVLRYQKLVTQLLPFIADLEAQTQNLSRVANDTTITNAPFTPQQGLQNLLTGLSGFDAQKALVQFETVLLGLNQSPSLLDTYLQLLSFRLGVAPIETAQSDSSPVWANSPVLTNTDIFDPFEQFAFFYAQQQLLAMNLLAEDANLSILPSEVANARVSAQRFQTAILEESQRLGFPLDSDFYLANPQAAFEGRGKEPLPSTPSGTLFYTQLQAPVLGYADFNDDGQALIDQAESFQAPGYPSGWRLASLDELEQLRALALQADPGNVINGLVKMGFSVPANWGGAVWYPDYDDPFVPGLTGPRYLKVYTFSAGAIGGYDETTFLSLYQQDLAYIQVNYLPFDSSRSYEEIVAAGFRPTTAPQLTLSPDGTRVTATLNGEDISQYCTWTSSSSQLEVRSLGEDAGTLVWHPGESPPLVTQTVIATIQGMNESNGFNETLLATLEVPVPTPVPTRDVTSILLSPSNSILQNTSVATPFRAVAFYSDQSLEDLTSQVVWSLELPDGSPYPAGTATINGSIPGTLIFTGPVLGNSTLVIRATLGSVSGTTQLEVVTPF